MSAADVRPWPMPPHLVLRGFLPEGERAALLAWAIENEERFRDATLRDNRRDPGYRIASVLSLDGTPWRRLVRERVGSALPELFAKLGTRPFDPRMELELAAHNDGAFYKAHIDTFTGEEDRTSDRVLSGVFYFYREPKAFSGGALRLYRFGSTEAEPGDSIDIEPEQNSFAVFPSWARHEVRPVSCPSRAFADSRFAVNCWLRRPAQTAAQ